MQKYHLYSTLVVNTPNRPFSDRKRKILLEKLREVDEERVEPLFMLIIEHSRVNGVNIDFETFKLPYRGKVSEKNDVTFKLEKFPDELLWVLWKFFGVTKKKK